MSQELPPWARKSDETESLSNEVAEPVVVTEEAHDVLDSVGVDLSEFNIVAIEPDPVEEDSLADMWQDVPVAESATPEPDEGLFEHDELKPGWKGWLDSGHTAKQSFFRGITYFDERIAAGAYATVEDAIKDAQEVLMQGTKFVQDGKHGDLFENLVIRTYGITPQELQKEDPPLAKFLERCWRVGEAEYKFSIKAALYKVAQNGNLDAQKTILTNTGDLTPEGARASSGSLYLFLDSDDAEA